MKTRKPKQKTSKLLIAPDWQWAKEAWLSAIDGALKAHGLEPKKKN